MLKKRTRYEIFATMLEVMRQYPKGCRITRLAYGAEIPNDRAKKYLKSLMENGLVEPSIDESGLYRITKRGEEFLETYYKLTSFLDLFEEA